MFAFLVAVTAVVAQTELASASSTTTTPDPDYRFAIMAKSINNTFFYPVREGAQAQAARYYKMDALEIGIDWVGGTFPLCIPCIYVRLEGKLPFASCSFFYPFHLGNE